MAAGVGNCSHRFHEAQRPGRGSGNLSRRREMLPLVLGIRIELAFQNTYRGAPMFLDVDPFLRAHSFTMFDITSVDMAGRNGPEPGSVVSGKSFRRPGRQVFEGYFLSA